MPKHHVGQSEYMVCTRVGQVDVLGCSPFLRHWVCNRVYYLYMTLSAADSANVVVDLGGGACMCLVVCVSWRG